VQPFHNVVRTVRQAISALPKGTDFDIAALLYIQGESDSEPEARASGERLRLLVENLRRDLPRAKNMKVLVGGIAAAGHNRDIVRDQQSRLPAIDPTFRVDFERSSASSRAGEKRRRAAALQSSCNPIITHKVLNLGTQQRPIGLPKCRMSIPSTPIGPK
jgi:hypothetical protein